VIYLIAIVALIATIAFYRRAKIVGLHPGKAASIPFVTVGILLGCGYLASLGIAKIAIAFNASYFTWTAVNFMLNLFLILAFLTVIRRTWMSLKRAPQTDSGKAGT